MKTMMETTTPTSFANLAQCQQLLDQLAAAHPDRQVELAQLQAGLDDYQVFSDLLAGCDYNHTAADNCGWPDPARLSPTSHARWSRWLDQHLAAFAVDLVIWQRLFSH